MERVLVFLSHNEHRPRLGYWRANGRGLANDPCSWADAVADIGSPLFVLDHDGETALGHGGSLDGNSHDAYPAWAYAGPCLPESLGDASFIADCGLRYAYVAGAMANGIASEDVVIAMGRAGMLSFFGAAGLPPRRVEQAIDTIQRALPHGPYGFNLIHSPNEASIEAEVADLYIRRGIRLVEASAYLRLTLPIVKYRLHGIHRSADGRVETLNRVIAKISRVEVAEQFFSPAPEKLVQQLVDSGDLTPEQARLSREVPMAQDLSAEADSGGHTDNRPAIALLPTMIALRDRLQAEFGYAEPLRVGLGGGISTPASAAAAFAMGAAYVFTGSVNQACVESDTSDLVRRMLAEAQQADTAMAPAADMFEMGVKVQVLKRGTMFSQRASKLYELYRAYGSLDEIDPAERAKLEKTVFKLPLDEVWRQTHAFFAERDPRQNERAERDPRHKMALVFRWYLGQSSHWANRGVEDRKMDFQVWCGPAMGAFNEWTKGTHLEQPEERRVAEVAKNILYGACVLSRVNALRAQGVPVPPEAARVVPLPTEALDVHFANQSALAAV